MPVSLDLRRDKIPANRGDRSLSIGLVNNMGDEALRATERQFVSLLHAASEGVDVRLSLYTLPGVARSSTVEGHVRKLYSSMEELWSGQLDGLIVTGREPLATRLENEPYWHSFTRLLEWAWENTYSTIWSCLAAHAAVLHMDGIERIKRNDKLFGIFACEHRSRHPLIAGTPDAVRMPHSRWNGIAEERLIASGYEVLTGSGDVGVDSFIKQDKNLFVFFQGHPEYATDTLLREYRRDVGRYDRGETDLYPLLPHNYFAASSCSALDALKAEAIASRNPKWTSQVSAELESSVIQNTWSLGAARIYENWLQSICARKSAIPMATRAHLAAGLEAVSR